MPVVLDSSKQGAWYEHGNFFNSPHIVLGGGYDTANVLIHETNHARTDKDGRSSPGLTGRSSIPLVEGNARKHSREVFVDLEIWEETDGVVQEIQAAQEFRASGYPNFPVQDGETEYDNAYNAAKSKGASDAEAVEAGRGAVRQLFDSGYFVASTNLKTYSDFYGEQWDAKHPCFLSWCF